LLSASEAEFSDVFKASSSPESDSPAVLGVATFGRQFVEAFIERYALWDISHFPSILHSMTEGFFVGIP